MVVLIIGSRFGGVGIPSVLENFDFEHLKSISSKAALLEHKDKLSITQLEILKAVEKSIPVYSFVDEKVFYDHHLYVKNKGNLEIIDAIEFPSIQKKETAKYIFEFINFLTHRTHNNSISPFSRLDDIKQNLIGQWSQLFQRLLFESRNKSIEASRYLDFSERLDDLKSVIMASIATPSLRDTARGAIQYRHLLTFLSSLKTSNIRGLLTSNFSWNDLLAEFEIYCIKKVNLENRKYPDVFLIKNDGTFYLCRIRYIEEMENDWESFVEIDKGVRAAIIDVTLDDPEARRFSPVVYFNEDFDGHCEKNYSLENFSIEEFIVKAQ